MVRGFQRSCATREGSGADISQRATPIVPETATDVKKPPTVFIVDNRPAVLNLLEAVVKSNDLPVQCYSSAAQFIADQDLNRVGCVLIDPLIRCPGRRGAALAARVRQAVVGRADFGINRVDKVCARREPISSCRSKAARGICADDDGDRRACRKHESSSDSRTKRKLTEGLVLAEPTAGCRWARPFSRADFSSCTRAHCRSNSASAPRLHHRNSGCPPLANSPELLPPVLHYSGTSSRKPTTLWSFL